MTQTDDSDAQNREAVSAFKRLCKIIVLGGCVFTLLTHPLLFLGLVFFSLIAAAFVAVNAIAKLLL